MPSVRLRLPRKLSTAKKAEPLIDDPGMETNPVDRSGARYIRELPPHQFELVIECMKDGVSLDNIAAYFASEGMISVTEKSFKQYLGAFKRVYPEFLIGESSENLNGIVSKRRPKLDEEQELEQLIRVQSRRLKVAVDFEIQSTLPNQHLHKDVKVASDMIENLAKMRGKLSTAGRPTSQQAVPASAAANEELRNMKRTEDSVSRISSLFGQLGNLVKQREQASEAD